MPSVRVYTTRWCGACRRAMRLLEKKGVPFEHIDLTDDDELRDRLSEMTGWQTVPMIFIGDLFVGGADDLAELDRNQELDRLLSGQAPVGP